jgi:hypothetical protein
MTAVTGGADCAPARLAATRAWWHRVAEHMPAAALYRATGQIGLVPSPGGFRTPSFGTDARFLAVDGTELAVSGAAGTKRAPLTTVRAAAQFAVHIGGYPRAARRSAATVRNGNLGMSPAPQAAASVSIPEPARSWHQRPPRRCRCRGTASELTGHTIALMRA